ncbi:MAG: hypothetical protein GX201_09620 [Clostridiales bacterium]|nr:hypothetical protein [Clostridiales bacterium]
MDSCDFYKTMKKAIIAAIAVEKLIKFSKEIDDISKGIEEIEKSFKITTSKKAWGKNFKFF